jgi:hypothetical protein
MLQWHPRLVTLLMLALLVAATVGAFKPLSLQW